ncbi:Serine/threonine protein phosphatase 2A 57 kDa regulatory subunit B' kappa isoform [Camellia lanceoleosa]|uniref:Serine/threonine protein phosphatase 2A 57 kDa regulatory subunit B' kappa isoform n=1 Tax=Camellia lanceoleosa TaxID=1840588 RepID=A0ACC0IHH2_9ERIC|nr:Serine/threonine protein phosphatase 2A 57 kDa regulatory subunit B' kappa isoform [Camellia lanceoleosa]
MGAQKTTPQPSPKKRSTSITLQHLFDLDSKSNFSGNNVTGKRTSFELENEEVLALISYTTFTYTFTDPLESPSQQDLKRLKLIQLLSIIKTSKTPLHSQILPPLFSMLSANLFRPLPPPCTASVVCVLPDDEDLAATLTAAWPHLQIVYDILLRVIMNTDAKALKDSIDRCFVMNLLNLFQTEDPRERESLKNVFHRIYLKFTFYRSFMRKAMNDVFLDYIFETDRHSGIGELLEIWGSIINGFTVPLKEEHKLFLMRVLIPLHKPKGVQVYHRQLAYCVSQFVQKEPGLGGVVVAERALYVWNNEQFVKMASQVIEEVFPVIVEGMERNLKWHWSKSVKQLTENVKVMLEEMEPSLYNQCLLRLQSRESVASQEEKKREEKWEKIEMAAAGKQFLQPPHYVCVSN